MRTWPGLSLSSVLPAPNQPAVLLLGLLKCINVPTKCQCNNTKRTGALCSFVPREPPLPRGVRFAPPAGTCSPEPGGAWEAGGGLEFLRADSAGRAQGPHTWSRGSCRFCRESRRTWSARRRCSPPAVERGRGRPGWFRSGAELLKYFNHDKKRSRGADRN